MSNTHWYTGFNPEGRLHGARNMRYKIVRNLEYLHEHTDCQPQIGESCYYCSVSYMYNYMITTANLYGYK